MRLSGQSVLVIGGGSGIGYAVAEGAIADGARVTIASTNEQRLADAAKRLGAQTRFGVLDVADERAVEAFFATDERYDHIAFTAGDWPTGGIAGAPVATLDLEEAAARLNVRFWGAVRVAKHAGARIEPGGSLTLTNGTIAHRPRKGAVLSTAMSGALEFLGRGLAVELAPVRVNVVCPGLVHTGIWDGVPEEQRVKRFAAMTAGQLIRRAGAPQEVAEAYLFFMRSTYTTGEVLHVEGGSIMGHHPA